METSNDKGSGTIEDEDKHQKVEKLLAQIMELESEKQESQKQFGAQRGKMKELFLQKEEEQMKMEEEIRQLRSQLDEARTQLTVKGLDLEARETEKVKSLEEMTSLQQLLSETLEEETRCQAEIRELKYRNEQLEAELSSVKTSPHHQSSSSTTGEMHPSGLNPGTMLTSLARKVASLGTTDSAQHNQAFVENLEESMRKAKEDAEVLRDLVVPLEEEISALKTKLRETDSQLQRYRNVEKVGATAITSSRSDTNIKESSERDSSQKSMTCDMCLNYEAQLVQAQAKSLEVERQLAVMEKYKEELAKETVFRKQMEEKWIECKEEHKNQVAELQTQLKLSEKTVIELKLDFARIREELKKKLKELSDERRTTEERLYRLQSENEKLMGKYLANSQSIQNEDINLPDSVEKLQEMWLTLREQLINAKVGQERSEEERRTLECFYNSAQEEQERMTSRISEVENELSATKVVLHKEQYARQKMEQEKRRLHEDLESLKNSIEALNNEKKKLETSESELRNRLISLQTGLENGEAVQKDFVMLSQSLQKELERLRGQNNVLRWEHEEDVSECRGCEQPFKFGTKGKHNCRHCGRIFCISCLNHKVKSGPNQRESRVCQVCHTLLNSETAPYFSTEPPHQAK